MDTHPPLYYIFLNFVCSVFEGSFSKWYGIGLNLFFLIGVWISVYLLLQYFLKNRCLSLALSTIFCCSALTVSMVLFIRMYVLLMALTVFQSWFHLKLYQHMTSGVDAQEASGMKKMNVCDTSGMKDVDAREQSTRREDNVQSRTGSSFRKDWRWYLALAILTVLGVLTHYYFIIYTCLIAVVYVLALWKEKRFRDSWCYIGTMLVSAVIYVALYPAVLNHMFFKYRGREAVHKFLKETTLFDEVLSMAKSLNKDLFGGWLIPILLILALATVVLVLCRGEKIAKKVSGTSEGSDASGISKIPDKNRSMQDFLTGVVLILPSLIYFFGVSKASPMVSLRYVSPVAPMLFAAVVVWAKKLIDEYLTLGHKHLAETDDSGTLDSQGSGCAEEDSELPVYLTWKVEGRKKLHIWQISAYTAMILLSIGLTFYFGSPAIKGKAFTEKKDAMETMAAQADACVYLTADEYNWKMWEDYVYYPLFDGLYFIDGCHLNPLADEKLLSQDSLAIFVDQALDEDEVDAYLQTYLPEKEYDVVYETSYISMILAK